MNVVKELILFTAGLIMTVGLITVSLSVYTRAAEFGNTIVKREQRIISDYAEYDLYRYDGGQTEGNNIISYIKRVYELYDAEIIISTEKGTFRANSQTVISGLRSVNSTYYINPVKQYSVSVKQDENGAVSTITINQIK